MNSTTTAQTDRFPTVGLIRCMFPVFYITPFIYQSLHQTEVILIVHICSSTVKIHISGQTVTVSQSVCIESMCTDTLSFHPRAHSHAGDATTGNYCAVVKHHYSLICPLAPSVLLGATLHTISTAPRTTPPT